MVFKTLQAIESQLQLLPFWCERSCRQHINEWVWLWAIDTLCIKTGSSSNLSHSLSVFAIEGNRKTGSSLLGSGGLVNI